MKCLFLALLYFFLPSFAYADEIYFQENFLSISPENWNIYQNGGSVETTTDGLLKLSSTPGYTYPYIHNNKEIFPESTFSAKIRFKFDGDLNYGSGIVISDKLIQNELPDNISPSDIVFLVWPESNSQYSIWTTLCEYSVLVCNTNNYKKIFSFPANTFEVLSLDFDGESFFIKLNDSQEKRYIASTSLKYIWIGNPQKTNTVTTKPNIYVDYFMVETPTKAYKDPVVILPGFGGSWDLNAVLTNSPGNNWKIPKFIKEYDGIINSLKNAGYEEDKDMFVFAYDWRKPLDSLANDLNSFIISKNIGDKKVSFVGHSMGGLVARTYLQRYNSQNTKKIVTVGTPHKGIIDAYGMWEGLTVWDAAWWQKVLHLVATEVNRKSGETELQAARRVSPSVKDLLPTWDFLQKRGSTIPVSQMTWKNDYLLDKNVDALNFSDRIFSGFSSNYQSKNKLLVTNRTNEDTIKGLWQDGKPVKTNTFMFSLGDGYVTSSSSGELFENKISLAGNHGEIISKKENIVKILQEVGVATGSAVGSDHDNRKKVVVFKLNSPGKLEVCQMNICDENLGLVFEDSKMVMVPGFAEEKFEIKVKSLGELGSYELLVGEIDENAEWVSSNGRLAGVNHVDGYSYIPGRNQLTLDPVTNVRNISIYFTNGLEPRDINKTRQEILRQMDVNIGLGETDSFDLLVEKWLAIDNFATSLDQRKTKGMNHKEWSEANNGFVRSKFVSKTPNYFSERLVELYSDLEASLAKDEYDEIFHKLDKRVQLLMLRAFLRL